MKSLSHTMICALLVSSSSQAWAHGIHFDITLANGTLASTSVVEYTVPDSNFSPNPTAAPVRLHSAGGYYAVEGAIPAGTAFTVEATGSDTRPLAMYYWNGGGVVPSPVNVGLNRTGIDAFSQTLTPSDTFLPLTTLAAFSGAQGNHSAINLDLALGDPTGLYVIGFRVSAPGLGTSDTFWGIANNGVTDPLVLEQGLAAIAGFVPEPSSMFLLAIGSGIVLLTAWRRHGAKTTG